MSAHSLRYAVNCSVVLAHRPLLERAGLARRSGFEAVEFWWPWDAVASPGAGEVDAFVRSIGDAGVQLVALNFCGGDLGGADAGLVSIPGREDDFRVSVDIAVEIAERTGTSMFNALYGVVLDGVEPGEQEATAFANLEYAAQRVAELGGTVLIEPLSGDKPYPLRTTSQVLAVIDRMKAAGLDNVGFLCDLFHLASNGDDVERVVADHVGRVTHVQIADAPGRHEPGTGALPLSRWLATLESGGYAGWVGLEYRPTDPASPFGWLGHSASSEAGR